MANCLSMDPTPTTTRKAVLHKPERDSDRLIAWINDVVVIKLTKEQASAIGRLPSLVSANRLCLGDDAHLFLEVCRSVREVIKSAAGSSDHHSCES